MSLRGDADLEVEVGGRTLKLSNLDKALFPSGFAKRDLIDYYARIAPVLLAHLEGRPVTVKRFPNGTRQGGFVEKNAPRHAPGWIRTVTLPRTGRGWGGAPSRPERETTEYILVDEVATLVWLANLAAIELHTPQWRLAEPERKVPEAPDMLVFDLDPGAPATIRECSKVALRLRERTKKDGIELVAKTSGSKGLQCYGRIAPLAWPTGESNEYAHTLASELEAEDEDLIVSRMTKTLRHAKVLIDWSQNNPGKTTVTPYSLRALERPTVSTPVTWEEVESASTGEGDLLGYSPAQVLDRVAEMGDLFAPLVA